MRPENELEDSLTSVLNLDSLTLNLSDDTRSQGILINGVVYSLHIVVEANLVVITDNSDYSKIYAIYTREFYNSI